MTFARRYRSSRLFAGLAAAALTAACARHAPPPASPGARIAVGLDPVRTLQSDLDQALSSQEQRHTSWAILVQSLESGDTLYRLNASKLMMPASNMKIVTLAAAAERLGWDYRFETSVITSAPLRDDGALEGDLIVRGSGDPSIGRAPSETASVLDTWAETLWNAGIRRVDGAIVGDDNAFDDETLGAGWAWDYLGYGYAAPVGALQYHEDLADLVVRAGSSAGASVHLELRPVDCGLELVNRVVTAPAGSVPSIDLRRLPGSPRIEVTGSVPAGSTEFTETVSVDNPTEFFARALRAALMARGIEVRGNAIDIDDLSSPLDTSGARVLVSYRSPTLSELATVLMKVSQNLYADTLLKTLGRREGTGTAEGGRKVIREVLDTWGISPDDLVIYDGSGLSRYNYVTADLLVAILRHLYDDPRHRDPFMATLPIAAQDGSLANRFKGSKAEGNLLAKTGSIANVRCLSGYVRTADGEWLAFAILANHFNSPQASIDELTDRIVERLALVRRK